MTIEVAAVFCAEIAGTEEVGTPFGPVSVRRERWGEREVVFVARAADVRARVVAAKKLGAVHTLGIGRAVALADDLRVGEWVVPDDALDFTRNTPTTFFENHGLGYVQQSPPFCPETRGAIVGCMGAAARTVGVVVAGPGRPFTPAELRAWRRLGADIAMRSLAPEWYLCHELEIGYAPLGWVAWVAGEQSAREPDWQAVLGPIVSTLPGEHSWQGSNTAARTLLGDDWRVWIAPEGP